MNTPESDPFGREASGLQVEVGAKSTRRLAMRWLVLLVVSVAAIAATGAWLYAL